MWVLFFLRLAVCHPSQWSTELPKEDYDDFPRAGVLHWTPTPLQEPPVEDGDAPATFPTLIPTVKHYSDHSNDEEKKKSPSAYLAEIVLSTHELQDSEIDLEQRLSKLVCDGALAARVSHYKLSKNMAFGESAVIGDVETKIEKIVTNGLTSSIFFSTKVEGSPVLADIIIDDISQLSSSHISAVLRYPLEKLQTQNKKDDESSNKWWLTIGIIGIGLLVLAVGWILLFIYYNTCGKPIYVLKEPNEPARNEFATQLKDSQFDFAPVLTPILEDDEFEKSSIVNARARSTQTISATPQAEADEEELEEVVLTGPAEPDNIDADDIKETEDEDIHKLPSPEPEDSTSSIRQRPKSAGKTRPIRDREGNVIRKVSQQDVLWDDYSAAQRVYELYGVGARPVVLDNTPQPAPPTANGVIELRVASLMSRKDIMQDFL